MEGLCFAMSTTNKLSSKLNIIGSLNLHQNEPLQHKGHDFRFDQSIFVRNDNDFSIVSMMRDYMRQNGKKRHCYFVYSLIMFFI